MNASEQQIITLALSILEASFKQRPEMHSSQAVRDYLRLSIGQSEHEVFVLMLLDSQHRLIEVVELFRGTIDGAAIYPREVVKVVLQHNAAAVIMAHNHPSGVVEPSQADKSITRRISDVLKMIDVRVLDHFVISTTESLSFAEQGLL